MLLPAPPRPLPPPAPPLADYDHVQPLIGVSTSTPGSTYDPEDVYTYNTGAPVPATPGCEPTPCPRRDPTPAGWVACCRAAALGARQLA